MGRARRRAEDRESHVGRSDISGIVIVGCQGQGVRMRLKILRLVILYIEEAYILAGWCDGIHFLNRYGYFAMRYSF